MSGNRRDSTTMRPVGEEPPYLSVGTEVSAKYRGAFCEANIKSVKKLVKCKVNFDKGNGNSTVTDDCIIGPLKVGSEVEVKLPESQENVTGTLAKITDFSTYTVVFDDGDERTLKRTSLCLKGEKHFNESETLDHLPLTDPENFGTPVMQQGKKSRKGRRHSTSNDGDERKETGDVPAKKKCLRSEENIDKVVMVDITERKKTFSLPALRVSSVGSKYGELKSPENVLVRSFRDGKYIEVHPKDVKEFSKEIASNSNFPKGESASLKLAVTHAVKYLEAKQLPSNWIEEDSKSDEMLENCVSPSTSGDESEDDEKERDEFMASLTKFLEEKGTPLLRSPVLGHRDLDLYKLFKIVSEMDGMEKVTSWHNIYEKMDIPVVTTTASYHIKNAYKRYLFDYEQHQRDVEEKKSQAEGRKAGKNDKSCTKNTGNNATNSKQKEEIQSKSESDKESKELSPSEENKLSNYSKASRSGRAKNKEITKSRTERTKSLKSPNSPKLSPRSPCSPKPLSSISAPGSAGSPSPADSPGESRELRSKTGDVGSHDTNKDNESVSRESDSVTDLKVDASKRGKETDQGGKVDEVKDALGDGTKSEIKEKAFRNNTKFVKGIVNLVDSRIEERVKGDNEKLVRNVCVKKDGVKKENEKKEEIGKEDSKEVEEKMEQDEVTELDCSVDVVNSPSGTSNESVDGDCREEKKSNKKSTHSEGKMETAGKVSGKAQGSSSDGGDLEYKLNDRIDVKYGRGRNATVYQAKITSVDPSAEECYLVHYAGWNARHDEWIGPERIIGRGQKQTRTRNSKETPKNTKPTPKPTVKPTPKPVTKKNGKNSSAEKQSGKASATKSRKKSPSPIPSLAASRNGIGRSVKNRGEKSSVDSLDLSDVKCHRVTRQNSVSTPVDPPESDFAVQKSQEIETEAEKSPVTSAQRASPTPAPRSPTSHVENSSDSSTKNSEEPTNSIFVGPSPVVNKIEETAKTKESSETGRDNETNDELNSKIDLTTTSKRPNVSEDDDSPAAKRKHEDDITSEVVFEEKESPGCVKDTNDPVFSEHEANIDEANTPDLTCSEQMSTNCVSPDPYTNELATNDAFFGNGMCAEQNGNGLKEKDSSSSVDEAKSDRSTNRKTKGRRDRKTRLPSSQSSFEGNEFHNGPSNGTPATFIASPTWTPRYNFTEDLEELLKKEESSERIRLLQEKIKDIRKVYGELKSEVANIDRKRKRRQKRKREEELSAEESTTRSPSRSSPLSTTNTNTVASSNSLAAVECR